jgi:alginate O-acetyltransferase complex protein AlgI
MPILELAWLAWIAAAVFAAWLSPAWLRPWLIGGIALLYLALHDLPSALILLLMAGLTYGSGARAARKGLGTAAAAVLILGMLVVFKVAASPSLGLAMPLGMSYYTFRCLHYLLERLKQNLPRHTVGEFAAYLFFLPTLIAGPIHRFPEFHRDHRRARFSMEHLSAGFERILYGYAKILLLANFLIAQRLAPAISALEGDWPWGSAYLGMLAGGFTGYLMFAGYSDVAIGAARLMGYRVIENFDNPFASRNIVEFWRRWHISLTSWVREYLYTAVFALTRRPYLAAMVALMAIAVWHEFSWRYVIWGLAHGAAVALCQWYQRRRTERGVAPEGSRLGRGVAWFVTFHFIILSFVVVQHDAAGAIEVFSTLIGVAR